MRFADLHCSSLLKPFHSSFSLTLSHDVSKALVRFDFEACDYTNLLTTSIEALTFTDELNTIVDMTLNPVIARAPFLPSSFTDNVKASIVSEAEAKVNEVKTEVISQLNSLLGNCARRRLSQMKLNEDGSQRMLQGGLNFGDLATSIEVIDGVVSVFVHKMQSFHCEISYLAHIL
jgi:hypothetical protein